MLLRIKQLGYSKGLQLLSSECSGMASRYIWLCKNKHKCSATVQQIQTGFQCKKCRNLISEEKVRFIFNELTGERFIKTRKALDSRLELDGYCDKLHIAFEYNGPQHYYHHPVWHQKSNNTLFLQQERDCKKDLLCRLKNIEKLNIKFDMIADLHALTDHIKRFLIKNGITIRQNAVDWSKFDYLPDDFNVLKKHAEKRQGKLLTPCFWGSHSKHAFKCGICNNEWEALSKDVLQKNSWCPNCANNQKKDILYLSKIATEVDLLLLSKNYHGMNVTYDFACKRCQNLITISANNVQQKRRRCPVCAGNKPVSAKEFNGNIRRRDIKLLDEFSKLSMAYSYKCLKCNHVWQSKASDLWHGHGCPQCAILNKRLSIDDLRKLGRQRHLRLLSDKYMGRFCLHTWECISCNRILHIKPVNVKRGTSCRKCKKYAYSH